MSDKNPNLANELVVKPGTKVDLSKRSPGETFGVAKHDADKVVEATLERLTSLQERIWAEEKRAVLIVLQGMDTSGKDGTIRHVMRAFNPQGCDVAGFRVPTPDEAAHDYLWRIHARTPRLGEIVIFNRSHYESVLVVRVHDLVPKARWSQRYDEINEFERLLASEDTTILKFFLHIDRDEQLARLRGRLDDPSKRWKFQTGDLAERDRWDDYVAAYEDALSKCSTEAAPWYVIPANHKWFRNFAVGEIVADRLEALKPAYPIVKGLPKPSDLH